MKRIAKIIVYVWIWIIFVQQSSFAVTDKTPFIAGLFPTNRPFSNTHSDTVRMVKKRKNQKKPKIDESWEYRDLLKDIKKIMSVSKTSADDMKRSPDVFTCWQIGQRIYEAQQKEPDDPNFSIELYTCLEKDLHIEKNTIKNVVLFYTLNEILASISKNLSWPHYEVLMSIPEPEKRHFYQDQTLKHSWGVDTLKNEINGGLYEKQKSALYGN